MRNKTNRWLISLLLMALIVFFAGCGEAASPVPPGIPTESAPPTSTLTPSGTATPTLSLTLTETPTEAPTLTPTLPYNAPGTYVVKKCNSYKVNSPDARNVDSIVVCVNTVKINNDLTMRFFVNWRAKLNDDHHLDFYIQLDGYASDASIEIIDNLQREYRFVEVGGCAAETTILKIGRWNCDGWFDFPAAEPGATSFAFIDFRHGLSIDNIVLLKRDAGGTPTFTLTVDPTLTSTLTSTPTADPNQIYNAPGTYYFYRCVFFPSPASFTGAYQVKFCMNTVIVDEDQKMRVTVTWTAYFDHTEHFYKPSDSYNTNIFLEDNLGVTYHHTGTGGCAAEVTRFRVYGGGSDDCSGWFQFPAAEPGATSFRFADSANGVAFENIVLVPKDE